MSEIISREKVTNLSEAIIFGIQEKKGKDICVLDLRHLENPSCDYFIICSGDSSTHVKAIAESVSEETRKLLNDKPWHIEGLENSEWILLDYVNIVVHVFLPHVRDFYNIEELWADAKIKVYQNIE
ncbi:MAG: ribosome silencing factor [Bacteroidetes bacterium]|nr:MAG: ribosome silencing factor [Bacteroidota bacterium]